jgi:hypothetical protein
VNIKGWATRPNDCGDQAFAPASMRAESQSASEKILKHAQCWVLGLWTADLLVFTLEIRVIH